MFKRWTISILYIVSIINDNETPYVYGSPSALDCSLYTHCSWCTKWIGSSILYPSFTEHLIVYYGTPTFCPLWRTNFVLHLCIWMNWTGVKKIRKYSSGSERGLMFFSISIFNFQFSLIKTNSLLSYPAHLLIHPSPATAFKCIQWAPWAQKKIIFVPKCNNSYLFIYIKGSLGITYFESIRTCGI